MKNTQTITKQQSEEAVKNVKTMLEDAESEKNWDIVHTEGTCVAFYRGGQKNLLKRYENGERTPDLYEEMVDLMIRYNSEKQ